MFLHHVEQRREDHHGQNDDEACKVSGDAGDGGCDEQDGDQRIGEAVEQVDEDVAPGGFPDFVGAVTGQPRVRLRLSQPFAVGRETRQQRGRIGLPESVPDISGGGEVATARDTSVAENERQLAVREHALGDAAEGLISRPRP
jgi:hypothetical protein